MADYITTYTGIRFYPTQPDPEGIRIEDVAHALSLLCRGNGHVSRFWSVAEHCIVCAREAAARQWPDRLVLACLLHDASECYLSDVPRPFKQDLAGYREHEDRLLSMIYTRFLGSDLTAAEAAQVREIDDGALWYDLRYLLHNERSGEKPSFHIVPDLEVRPFEEAEREYLDIFNDYYARLHGKSGEEPAARLAQRPLPDYDLLACQLREFAAEEPSLMPLLSNAAALLWDALGDVNWAGFYLRRDPAEQGEQAAAAAAEPAGPELLLGPFQGRPACIRIPWGRGVCGTAALEDRTVVVPDVHAFPGHIACDSASNAEIVIPIHAADGSVAGVLDIDSPLKDRFTEADRAGLEAYVRTLEETGVFRGPEEVFDLCDADGNPTGETAARSIAHRYGLRHRTVHIWVVRETEDGRQEVLLQKRSMNKDSFPGMYDTSSAGHIQAGCEPLPSARRELEEELGIHAAPEDLHYAGRCQIFFEGNFHGRIFREDEVAFVYVYDKPVAPDEIRIQEDELESVEWFGLDEVAAEVLRGGDRMCVPPEGLEVLQKYLARQGC